MKRSTVALLSGAGLAACAAFGFTPAVAAPTTGVLTFHNDNGRTGQNLLETTLTPKNVNQNAFGLRYTQSVDGQVYAEPLIVPGVSVPGRGTYNVVLVATEHNSVYAFSADANTRALWHVNLGPSVPAKDTLSGDLTPEIGITSTPVVDPASGTVYVVAKTKENNAYFQRLHALDVHTGAEKFGGPVQIRPAVMGTGDGSRDGREGFNALRENQRAGLLLSGGVVYAAFASHGDNNPYHGWVLGFDAQTLQPAGVFNDTPDGSEGGIWQSGTGPSADSAGRIFLTVGNGTFDPASGEYGEGFLRLAPGKTITVSDFFTPYNYADLNNRDADIGSGGVLLLPDQSGPHQHLLLSGGKAGVLYLVDRDRMGGVHDGKNFDVQELEQDDNNGLYSCPAYFGGQVYYCRKNSVLTARTLSNGLLSTSAASVSSALYGFPGATPAVSANGTQSGIVWTLQNSGNAVLHAYDAADLSRELYNSGQAAGAADVPGPYVKFSVPTVANGKVYVGTKTGLAVFGLR